MAARSATVDHYVDDTAEREVMTGEAVALDVRPVGFVLRAAGSLIDCLVSAALLVALIFTIQAVGAGLDQALVTTLTTASLVISLVVLPMTVELATHGRSLGKLAIGARIVRDDGGAVHLRHTFIRALTGVVEIFLTFGGLAALCALLNSKAKRLGDLLAGTYSQHERVPRILPYVYGVPPQLAGWALTADVATLPDRLSRRIAAYLRQAGGMTPIARAGLAAELAAEASAFVSPIPQTDPEFFLAGVAALRRDRDFTALLLERERMSRLRPALTDLPHAFPDR